LTATARRAWVASIADLPSLKCLLDGRFIKNKAELFEMSKSVVSSRTRG
jgi:hypothetical protein